MKIMGREHFIMLSRSLSFLILSFLLSLNFAFAKTNHKTSSSDTAAAPSAAAWYTPPDNYLIDCGSPQDTKLDDGRTFKSDSASQSYLETNEEVLTSIDSIDMNASSVVTFSPSALPLCRSARILTANSKYTFYITRPGWHWTRLYFYPLPHPVYNLTSAVFTVTTDQNVLLQDFSVKENTTAVFKEYLVNVSSDRFSLIFKPQDKSFAFINAIEVVSAPDDLISDSVSSVPQGGTINGLFRHAFEVSYRLNVGGPTITPINDTLSRTWLPDTEYNAFLQGAQNVSVAPNAIRYPQSGATPDIAPNWVYATAYEMAESDTLQPNFNLTWVMGVDPGFSYLIRMHFCDIVSQALNDLYFNVYINTFIGVSGLDLSSINNAVSMAYYADFVLNASSIKNGSIRVQVGPASGLQSGMPNAILNGLEVIKMSNSVGSLDGLYGVDGSKAGKNMKIVAGVGLAMGVTTMLLLSFVCIRWHRSPADWEKRNSFSSWLLPIHSSQSSFLSSKSNSRRSSIFGSRKSKSGYSSYFSNQGLGRYFTFSELQNATQNFDEKTVIGVGGFGKVYLGVLEDGSKIAIKRGSPGSEQGINEFQTEIQMLSKLRHRHLVSLIGFSDEQSEMILVYEYMANGPLRDHIYGSNKPPLSWKQRLEICIGAARGLHYLHTGAAQGIIHRDVKTTNILLDENFVAKVSDFGLSKAAPMEQAYVSTAVKGSFGYLDPEYFRRQQLTEKSDVYSFGVVLFEALCARQVINPTLPREQVNLAEWAMQRHRKGLIGKIIDPHIAGTISEESLKKYVEAAEKCLAEHGVDRPGMGDVLWNLEYALQLQEASSSQHNDLQEDKSSNLMAFGKPSGKNSEGGDSGIPVSDDSDVSLSNSALFSQTGNFPGR